VPVDQALELWQLLNTAKLDELQAKAWVPGKA
jgi:hypothetical protein